MKKISTMILAFMLCMGMFGACNQKCDCDCNKACDCDKNSNVSNIVGGNDNASSGNVGGSNKENESTMDMVAHYDYGFHMENGLTLLLDGCNLFFKPADYGIAKLVAGDIITITYKGGCYIQETYPGTVVTKDMTIIDVTVQEAPILELTVMSVSDGYDVFYGNNGVACNTNYVINEDGTFEKLGEKHVGEKLYGTIHALTSFINIMALYSYNPRPDTPIVGDHTCMLVCLEEVEPTCQTEGKTVIGCTYCGDIYEETILEKVNCQLDENGKCIWCEQKLSNIYTWINDLTADDILSMKQDTVTYGVAPGMRVDSRTTTQAQADKETILAYLQNLTIKAVSDEEGQVDGGGGVHLDIHTEDATYGIRINNGYIYIGGIYYQPSENIPTFGEDAAIWEACCLCGSFDCTGHDSEE